MTKSDARRMDLWRLECFCAVARAGSFSKAATVLFVTQPALSHQISTLEADVGQRLFHRSGRGVAMTDSGQALLVHAREMLALAERAEADMRDRRSDPSGRVMIGLPPRVARAIAADLVQQFREEFENASICVEEGFSIRLRESLVGGQLDLGVLFDPPPTPALTIENLAREKLVLIDRRPLPAQLALADLVGRPLVLPSRPNAVRQLLEEACAPRGYRLTVAAEIDSMQTILLLVSRGVGSTVLPASVLREWPGEDAPHHAVIHKPTVHNRLCIATPKAKASTKLTRHAALLIRQLCHRHYASM